MARYTLDLIDLDLPRKGYRKFISSWLCRADGFVFVVDPGPRSTVDHLIVELRTRGVDRVDDILLTHVHLDHGGGAAHLMEAFPSARLFCHEKGVRHVIDPSTLWQGSVRTIGEVARLYGEPGRVPKERLANTEELAGRGIRVIPTPGHASHHVCFVFDDILFAGEAIATRMELPGGRTYLRSATPARFFLETSVESIERLAALAPEPRVTAFGHYGRADGAIEWCRRARQQLHLWVDTLAELRSQSESDLRQRFFDRLLEVDPFFGQGRFDQLPEDIQARERYYLGNSMNGILGYLKARAGA